MDAFRNLLKGWVGKVLLALFILPFAFFGIEGIFQSLSRGSAALVVDDIDIPRAEIDRIAQAQRENLARQMGDKIDPSAISLDMVRPAAVEFLIRKALLSKALDAEGFAVPQDTVKAYVRNMQEFKDDKGEFSQQRLEQLLAQVGYSGTGFFAEVRQDLLLKQLETSITASNFASEDEVKQLIQLDRQLRDIRYLAIKAKDYKKSVTVTDEEVKRYYQANSNRFQTAPKTKVEYLYLTADNFELKQDVTEAELKAAYEKQLAGLRQKERRRAQHVLVEASESNEAEALEKIKQAQAELKAGADFDKIAEKYSDDKMTAKLGGDLGFAGRGLYDPAFEEALFSLQKGQVSEIVSTEFGFHLIKLTAIEQQEMPAFAAEKPKLLQQLQAAKKQEAMLMAIEDLNQKAFEHPESLVDASEIVVDAEVKTTDWFTRNSAPQPLQDANALNKIFAVDFIEERVNSEVIELANKDMLLVRTLDYEPASVKPLQDVETEVKAAVVADKARDKTAEVANQALAKLNSGTAAESIAKELNKEWQQAEKLGRQGSELDPALVKKAFATPEGKESAHYDKVSTAKGDQLLLTVNKVHPGEYGLKDQETRQMQMIIANRFGQFDFNNYVETLRAAADIKQNSK